MTQNSVDYYQRQRWLNHFEQARLINHWDMYLLDFLGRHCGYRRGASLVTGFPIGVWAGTVAEIVKAARAGRKDVNVRDSFRLKLLPVGLVRMFPSQKGRSAYVLDDFGFEEGGKQWHVDANETTDWRHPAIRPGEGKNWMKHLAQQSPHFTGGNKEVLPGIALDGDRCTQPEP